MARMTPAQIMESHARGCSCTPVWVSTQTGQALQCAADDVLIWWPSPDTEGLTVYQDFALFCHLPMMYDSDSDTAMDVLLRQGYEVITPANYMAAYRDLRRYYEADLWQDNVAKQLFGRLQDGDLEGEV